MSLIFRHSIALFLFCSSTIVWTQTKVGLVLSGGGASGLAHIGVLKALEERGISISYITGSSSGALVGAMYACGYTPKQIEEYVLSEEFQYMAAGKANADKRFLYREAEPNASLLGFSFKLDSLLKTSIPLNVVNPAYLDFEMMKLMGRVSASKNKNFDQLFIPFRCVASDIVKKEAKVFDSGDLNAAVRASMSYPFYINPVKINDVVYFDGGLYNNFPVDVMCAEFKPDFIVGSNVSKNAMLPDEQDFFGLLENMMALPTNFDIPCQKSIMIQPKVSVGTFGFSQAKKAIDEGYQAALLIMDSLIGLIPNHQDTLGLAVQRSVFLNSIKPINVGSISTQFHQNKTIGYISSSLIRPRKREIVGLEKLEKRYYRLCAAQQIDYIYPTLTLTDSLYDLNLFVRKSKSLKLEAGGHLSSRPVNTGYLGLTYRNVGKTAYFAEAESYFGKLYSSLKLETGVDIPSVFPVSTSAYFVLNSWDYFRSFATFFEDIKPSFLIQNEMYFGAQVKHPLLNNSKGVFDARYFLLNDEYYQTPNFLSVDTADRTQLVGGLLSYELTDNALNRKQFASEGHFFQIKLKYLTGQEQSIPGTTSAIDTIVRKQHDWINLRAELQFFPLHSRYFHLGIHAKAMFNSQSLFANYTASLLAMPNMSVIPDMETYFMKEYRSPQCAAFGLNLIFPIHKFVDYRLDWYYYQPFIQLYQNNDGTIQFSKPFKGETWIGSTSVIYHSPLGPLRATLNYFPLHSEPLNFQISFGYVLFNERAVR